MRKDSQKEKGRLGVVKRIVEDGAMRRRALKAESSFDSRKSEVENKPGGESVRGESMRDESLRDKERLRAAERGSYNS